MACPVSFVFPKTYSLYFKYYRLDIFTTLPSPQHQLIFPERFNLRVTIKKLYGVLCNQSTSEQQNWENEFVKNRMFSEETDA